MKALVWEAPRVMTMHEQPIPDPQPGEVIIKVAYAGICGSELSGYLGHNALRVPPLVMGHEFSGEISALGDGVAEHYPALQLGTRVTANPLSVSGESEMQQRVSTSSAPAGNYWAHTAPVRMPSMWRCRPNRSRSCLRAWRCARAPWSSPRRVACASANWPVMSREQDCLIIGAGPIGLLALQALQLKGAARVFVADLDPARLAMSGELGAIMLDPAVTDVVDFVRSATDGSGAAVAVDAVGMGVTRTQCVAAVKTTGLVILSGLHEESSSMPAADIIRREIVVRGAFAYSPANFAQAIELLDAGKMGLAPWIVEAPLAEGGKWFDRLIDAPGDVSKVLLVP